MAWLRRSITIPAAVGLFAATTVALPVLLAAGLAWDFFGWLRWGRPFVALRLLAFLWVYLAAETAGLLAMGAAWLAHRLRRVGAGEPSATTSRYRRANARIADRWARALFAAMNRLFGLRYDVEGQTCLQPGPVVILARHASLADVLLPFAFNPGAGGLRLRYVLKRELAWDPCLDIGARRLGGYFVDRSGRHTDEELQHLRALARALGPRDGVVLFPEGTRFSLAKRERALARLAAHDPEAATWARSYRHVLPPHPGGTLALLEAGTDVVICAHHGFDGLAQVKDLLGGGFVGRRIRVRFWRISAAEVPPGAERRLGWLRRQWRFVDDWIDACVQDQHHPAPRPRTRQGG